MAQLKNSRQPSAAGHASPSALDVELAGLTTMTAPQLRKAWQERFASEPPNWRSRYLLLQEFAWRLQVERLGGLDAVTERKLREIAAALERDGAYEPKVRRDLSPGVMLTREWKGVVHKVTVMAEGFQHLGKRYRSLSDIARTITSTRWSGPRFFGLEQKSKKKPAPTETAVAP